jgi:hypothetical protein
MSNDDALRALPRDTPDDHTRQAAHLRALAENATTDQLRAHCWNSPNGMNSLRPPLTSRSKLRLASRTWTMMNAQGPTPHAPPGTPPVPPPDPSQPPSMTEPPPPIPTPRQDPPLPPVVDPPRRRSAALSFAEFERLHRRV